MQQPQQPPPPPHAWQVGGLWANPAFGNFDDIAAAALLLFEMAGMEGWPDVMYQGIDAVEVDMAPRRDAAVGSGLFFVLWIVVGGMFVLNLFVGVIVDTYTDVKEEDEGTKTMTDDQRQWRQIMAQSMSIQPVRKTPPPTNSCRKLAHTLVSHRYFEPLILGVILFNTALIALDDHEVSPTERVWLYRLNLFCTATFVFEAATKLVALGCAEYFVAGWHRFDFAVVALALPDLLEAVGLDAHLSWVRPAPTCRALLAHLLLTARYVLTLGLS